jgi:hypothetical protein
MNKKIYLKEIFAPNTALRQLKKLGWDTQLQVIQ